MMTIILIAILLGAGIFYIKENTQKVKLINSREQKYIKENRDIYGVSNKGTSMDNNVIFTVNVFKLGM